MIKPNLEERLETIVNRLRDLRIISDERLPVLYTDEIGDKTVLPTDRKNWKTFDEPYTIYEQEKYFWFKANFKVHRQNEHQKAFFCLDTHFDWNTNSATIRPQGIFYLDGKIDQGVDINHGDVLVDDGEHEIYIIFYSHTFNRYLPMDFSIRYIDERINGLYYDLLVPFQSLKMLDKKSNDYVLSITALEKALNLLDIRNAYSEDFYNSIERVREFLKNEYFGKICYSKQTVNCIAHTHIDVAWLWDLDQTKQKVERSFSTVLKIMDEYPEYRFFMSQPQLFDFLKERNPELYSRVKEKILQGRWEVDGAMWVEADCNLTSGESLVRQIQFGKRFFKEEFGVDCQAVWLPDVFGYSASLPQIMKKSGLSTFITAKIGWNDTNRMPYDIFNWKGIDGSEVLAYFLSTCWCDPRNGVYDNTYTTYTAPINAMHVLGTWNRFQQKEYTDTVIMSYGWGDGGGGPTREDVEVERRLSYGLPGIPATKIESFKDTLKTIENNYNKNAQELGRKPVWNGELYFEYHRGTLTSVPEVKMNNRKGEFAMLNAELFSVLSNKLFGKQYPKDELDKKWKLLLVNHFHDILPGSSIGDVYKDSREQFKEIFDFSSGAINCAMDLLTANVKSNGGILVFNPNGFVASGTVKSGDKTLIAKDIPAFGYKVIDDNYLDNAVLVGNKTLENSYYKITFTHSGAISSLFDKRENREVVKKGLLLNQMVAYQDTPFQYHNWEMTPYHNQNSWVLNDDAKFEEVLDGDRAGFKITKKYGSSIIEQTVYLYNDGIDRIDFVTDIVWKEKDQLLKAIFPVEILSSSARYDIQFGHVERAIHSNTSWDSARFESAGQKWVDKSENDYGVAILNDGKYGFGAFDEDISMTLVKSGGFPFDDASQIIPTFTYSILPHKHCGVNGGIVEKSYVLNRPFVATKIRNNGSGLLPSENSFISVKTKGVILETVKQAESGDGVIVRMYEAYKESKTASVLVGENKGVYLCDLSENTLEKLQVVGGEVTFKIKPFEIVTLKIVDKV
ncbi:MAG: alpha-mannosidase [Clostridia bacterium]|nr:alpha-mannosidase [Clostridia bacterium]